MIDSKTSKQPKPTTVADPKRLPEKMTTMPSTVISEEMIRARAYALYESRGREPGQDEQDWLRAEQEIVNGAGGTKARSASGYARKLDG
jgi:hypothetical protein